MKWQSILFFVVFLVFFAIQTARADLIPLHNTGEAGIGNVETNYTLRYSGSSTGTGTPLTAYVRDPYPWPDAPTGSEWIAPHPTHFQTGYYFYELSFNIPDIISISGRWASDNNSEIFLNGISSGYTRDLWGFLTLEDFTITSGFTGNDTLLFRVWQDSGGPTGLLVTDLTAEVVPVPSAVILGSLGLTFSGWLLKRKRML